MASPLISKFLFKSPKIALQVILLPLPDSPNIPKHLFSLTLKDILFIILFDSCPFL